MESPFVFDWVFDHARARPDASALGTPVGWTTYRELAGAVRCLANQLAEAGVGRGSFVLLALPSSPAAVAGSLAVQYLGACAVDINRELDDQTVANILAQTGARHALVHPRDARRWVELARTHGLSHLHVIAPGRPPPAVAALLADLSWTWVNEHHPDVADRAPAVSPPRADEPALLVYTSGSTGVPRGVVQTHHNIDANTRAICRYLRLAAEDRALSILPLFYCFGRSILQTHLFAGGSVFFDPRFMYPRVVMEALIEHRCTGFYGVPLTFESIRRNVDLRSLPPFPLRYVAQAGGAMQPDTIDWVRRAFAPAPLYVMYGQTEATARLSYLPPEMADEKRGSIGRGLDNVELRVLDPAGCPLPPGEVGEVVARGPSITPGYFNAPEETAAILHDGWLWTGDLGYHDSDGYVYLVGRARDMLKLAGHRVAAAEIERVLADHPAVEEAAVVGVSDGEGGEAAIAFVLTADGHLPGAEDLRRFCRQRLPAFKVPREIRLATDLPRTATGKVAKAELVRRTHT